MLNDRHDELNRTLGQILGELKGMNQRLDFITSNQDKHEERLNDLESFKDTAVGKFAVIGTVATFIFGIIGSYITDFLTGK